jgi:glutamate carboxypeptidase
MGERRLDGLGSARMIDGDLLDRLTADVQGRLPAYLDDLRQLTSIDCGTYSISGVNEVGGWLAEQLRELGAEVEVVPGENFGDTVVGRLRGAPGGPRLLVVGHMDTVFPEGSAAERPFRIDERRAYGPGVSDMKGGLLSGLYALRALRAVGVADKRMAGDWLPFGQLTYIGNPDEEAASPESTPTIRREAASADVAVVLESARANGDIVSARKGVLDLRLDLHGRAAHAGVEPEKGRSAIVEAAHKTLALSALNGRWPGVTLNVGVIEGGIRPNVVPARATLQLDLRATTTAALDEALAEVERICAAQTVPDVSCTMLPGLGFPPMERSAAIASLADRAIALAGRLGFELRDTATGGGSDASTIAALGVPVLDGLGPIGGGDHSPDEYVELESIVPRTALLAALMLDLGRNGPPARDQRR